MGMWKALLGWAGGRGQADLQVAMAWGVGMIGLLGGGRDHVLGGTGRTLLEPYWGVWA